MPKQTPSVREFTLGIKVVLGLSLLVSGCAYDVESVDSAKSELFGRAVFRGDEAHSDPSEPSFDEPSQYVSPYAAAYMERGLQFARTIASSSAFEACVANSMNAAYMNCADALPGATRSEQIQEIWRLFSGNQSHVLFRHNTSAGGTMFTGPDGVQDLTDGINLHINIADIPSTWDYYLRADALPVEPWNYIVGALVHEYVHRLGGGYWHVDSPSEQQACAEANGRSSYREFGEPSAPYIYEKCASSVLVMSNDQCGDVRSGCFPVGQLRLLSSWTGTHEDVQTSTSCVCESDPLHVVALRSNYNPAHVMTALNGGNDVMRTNWTSNIGAWQTFFVKDLNGGFWQSGDDVTVRSFNADLYPNLIDNSDGTEGFLWPSVSYWRTTSSTPRVLQFIGPVIIGNGSTVRLRMGSTYARDDVTYVRTTTSSTDTRNYWTVLEPRTDWVVYLKTAHGRYVSRSSSDGGYDGVSLSSAVLADYDDLNDLRSQARAAFHVIDWNGGTLNDGDSVSLRTFDAHQSLYLSVRAGDHLGQATSLNAAGPYETFVINLSGGQTGALAYSNDGVSSNDKNVVSFRSENGTYLTARPWNDPVYPNEVHNYGTYEGAWQWFTIIPVQEVTRNRPGW